MKFNVRVFALIIIAIFFHQCDFKCDDCFTPPEEIRIKLVDSEGNNLIENYTYIPDSIKLYYIENQVKKEVQFELSTYFPYFKNMIYSTELAWISIGERRDYYLRLSYMDTDTLTLELKEKQDDCCTFFDIEYFKINGKSAEYSNTEFVYLIRK